MLEIPISIGKHKQSGQETTFEICPFCNGGKNNDKWTFFINSRSGLYKCHRGTCGATGNLRQLYKRLNLRLPESLRYINTTPKSYKKPIEKTRRLSDKLYRYFRKRNISEDTVDFAEIRETQKGLVCFDYYDEQGELTFRKKKRVEDKKIFREKDTKPIFYMMNKVNSESDTLIITEGEEDCLSLYEVGYDYAVSLPSGSSDMNCLTHNWDWLQTFKTFIIWTDDDSAGHKAEKELISRLGKEKCRVVEHKKNDINETLVKMGKKEIYKIIEDSEFLPISNIKSVYDYDMFENKEEEHLQSTFDFINQSMHGGFRFGELIIWTGHPGTGKSTILQQESINFIKQGEKICVYSAEMMNKKILKNMYRQCSGQNRLKKRQSNFYDGYYYYPKKENVDKINKWMNENFYLVKDDFDTYSNNLFEIFAQVVLRKGVRVFVIDNLMTVVRQSADINHNQSEFIKKCSAFAKTYKVQIHVIAHQRKLTTDQKQKNNFHPTEDGIAGSANIKNLADVVIGLARVPDSVKNQDNILYDSEITIFKERVTGVKNRKAELFFDNQSLRFIENWNNINYKLGWENL
ncbi:MAG: DnaB-like helicase C-terminal domain-containing protein [Candidatus Cloacimonadota bacterium]|nr:DnaB-like helicase C-terminal domain-containing protein [Candidatus Cloacimonadota bacterium]